MTSVPPAVAGGRSQSNQTCNACDAYPPATAGGTDLNNMESINDKENLAP